MNRNIDMSQDHYDAIELLLTEIRSLELLLTEVHSLECRIDATSNEERESILDLSNTEELSISLYNKRERYRAEIDSYNHTIKYLKGE